MIYDIIYKVLDFINEYYHVVIVVIMLCMFIVSCFKPNKKADFIRVFNAVNKAEELFPERGSGPIKLAYVVKQCSDLNTDYVIKTVEEILSSPEKK